MKRNFIIITLFFGVSFCAPEPGLGLHEIVGGTQTSISSLPYQVSVELNGHHWSGGSIIREDIVVTAAHCTYDYIPGFEEYTVRAGSSQREKDGQVVKVVEIVNHEKYDPDSIDYDVALLKLEKPLEFGKNVQKILLTNNNNYFIRSNAQGIVSGWGFTKHNGRLSNDLMVASVPILKKDECRRLLPRFSDRMICAGYKNKEIDACQADSGGPLVYGGKLVGIVSWGIGCGSGNPGVYTDVLAVRDWIDENAIKLS